MNDTELDLGITPEKTEESLPVGHMDEQPEYPEVEMRGKHADLFRQKYGPCAPGDEYKTEVVLRVKSSSDGEKPYDKSIKFCWTKIIGDVVEESGEDKEEKPAKPARGLAKAKKPVKEEAAAY